MQAEIEVKFFVADKDATRALLQGAGFACTKPERLMRRRTFQFAQDFTAGQKWARVRDEGDKITLSVKEIVDPTRPDGTLEAEITVDDFDRACAVLSACGLHAMSLQENRRETWATDGVVATIDTWPDLDPVLEVEAESVARLDAVCALLALDRSAGFHETIDFIYARKYSVAPEVILKLPEISFAKLPTESLNFNSLYNIT